VPWMEKVYLARRRNLLGEPKKVVDKRESYVQRSSVCESYHRSVAEGPRLEEINGKVIIKTIAFSLPFCLSFEKEIHYTVNRNSK